MSDGITDAFRNIQFPITKDIDYLTYMINCLKGLTCKLSNTSNKENFLFFKVDVGKNGNKSLFFMTRIIDKRYFKYGHDVSIKLSVGDLYENDILPIFYDIRFESFNQVSALIDNFEYYMNKYPNFISGFDMEDIFEEIPSSKGYRYFLRERKLKRIINE